MTKDLQGVPQTESERAKKFHCPKVLEGISISQNRTTYGTNTREGNWSIISGANVFTPGDETESLRMMLLSTRGRYHQTGVRGHC